MGRPPKNPLPDAVLYRMMELLIHGNLDVTGVAETINEEMPGWHLTREAVYRNLKRGIDRGIIRLVPPHDEALARAIEGRFGCKPGTVRVVDLPRADSTRGVSAAAATLAKELVDGLWPSLRANDQAARAYLGSADPKKGPNEAATPRIGLAVGPGRATLDFAHVFGRLLDEDLSPPPFRLIAMSACAPALEPHFSPISFFNLIRPPELAESIGLYAETLIEAQRFRGIQRRPGVREAFAVKENDQIHLVVTSMGDREDPHSLYGQFYSEPGSMPKRVAREAIGDVQYRPYSKSGFLLEAPEELRPVTLFELDELVKLANVKDRYVILIARQCGLCKGARTRARPLRPLMEPHMRPFSHLVVDSPTARELLAG